VANVTERKPGNVSWETWIEAQIREARERGEFEDLPGYGKPLTNLDGDHDEMWWLRNWLKRNDVGFTPTAIALRKAAEDLLASLAKFPTERGLRTALDELNGRIREMNRTPIMDGPPSNLMPLDVEPVVERWRDLRAALEPLAVTAAVEPVAPPKRRWFRRPRP
jgi:hypothetical protein